MAYALFMWVSRRAAKRPLIGSQVGLNVQSVLVLPTATFKMPTRIFHSQPAGRNFPVCNSGLMFTRSEICTPITWIKRVKLILGLLTYVDITGISPLKKYHYTEKIFIRYDHHFD